ncbi:MAG: peptide ABC transporter substrate-binding protein [Chloroflexaceae bacterium]|nr:peptide ABC transporter substrate-binding protein [Chloroflexaceae bacterium]
MFRTMYQRTRILQCFPGLSLVLFLVLSLVACDVPIPQPEDTTPPNSQAPGGATTETEPSPGVPTATAMSGAATPPPPTLPDAAEEPAPVYTTIYGERLPDDAAPYHLQTYKVACDISRNQTIFDFAVSVYERICLEEGKLNDLFQDQLVTFDKDFNVIPASAERWEVSADGLTWTFFLRPGLVWSDGTPLTAYDWEATYRMIANPDYKWDFGWFYSGVLKNWDAVMGRTLPPEELGVRAVDDLTLEFTTETPQPAFPSMMQNSYVLQKKALETYGPNYNSRVETSVSSGPFLLTVYEPLVRIEMVANPTYQGYRKPRLQRLIGEYRDMDTAFLAFRNHEIDYISHLFLLPEDYEVIEQDPILKDNYLQHYGEFRTDYLFFDTYNPPFNDVRVRKAFAHAIDRETIVRDVFGEIRAMPAYGMLMPGFPGSDTTGTMRPYQQYDCEQAKGYLADAGYPGGAGFPALTMLQRNEPETLTAVYRATAASIQQCLGVPIEVATKDYTVFMDWLNATPTQIPFGVVSYGMDYLDPSNLLGVWVSTGRHAWRNETYDALVREANSLTGDPQRRLEMFRQAEQILVDDVGGIFLTHRWSGDLIPPYLVGDGFRQPDAQGTAGWHWGNDWAIGSIYVSKDVENYATYRDKLR